MVFTDWKQLWNLKSVKHTTAVNFCFECAPIIVHGSSTDLQVQFRTCLTDIPSINQCILGMCISITEADAIRISMHSQRYDTLKIHMKQLLMRCNMIHSYYDAVRSDYDSIWFNTMRFGAIRCNGKKYDWFYFFCFRQTAKHKLTCVFWLLTPWGPFHKTSLPNKPCLFQLVWLIVKWFGSIKQI